MLQSSILELRNKRKARVVGANTQGKVVGLNLNNSKLYQEFKAEKEEILKYKWIKSEKLGQDIEYERALLEWICKYRDQWREKRRNKNLIKA